MTSSPLISACVIMTKRGLKLLYGLSVFKHAERTAKSPPKFSKMTLLQSISETFAHNFDVLSKIDCQQFQNTALTVHSGAEMK